uniref:Uncharacterized protein n=1 Tax=Romanomermis culicivorax TaxID=13658 RepID=A0A915IHF8_ROMCU
ELQKRPNRGDSGSPLTCLGNNSLVVHGITSLLQSSKDKWKREQKRMVAMNRSSQALMIPWGIRTFYSMVNEIANQLGSIHTLMLITEFRIEEKMPKTPHRQIQHQAKKDFVWEVSLTLTNCTFYHCAGVLMPLDGMEYNKVNVSTKCLSELLNAVANH